MVPENVRSGGEFIQRSTTCTGYSFLKDPPGKVVECVRAEFLGAEFGDVSYYALTADGRVWSWEKSAGMIQDIFIYFLSLAFAFVLGIISFSVVVLDRKIIFKFPRNPA